MSLAKCAKCGGDAMTTEDKNDHIWCVWCSRCLNSISHENKVYAEHIWNNAAKQQEQKP